MQLYISLMAKFILLRKSLFILLFFCFMNNIASFAQSISVVSSNNDSICNGSSIIISANASGGNGGPYSYTWLPGGFNTSSVSVSPATTTTYTVTASDGLGNFSTATTTITVLPLPLVSFTSNVASACTPFCVSFTDQSNNSVGSIVYWNWNFGNMSSIATIANPSYCFTVPGLYDVTLTVENNFGCTATHTNASMISAFVIPTAYFSYTVSGINQVAFTDLSLDADSWDWDFGDGNTSNVQNPIHTYSNAGVYPVRQVVSTNFGCYDTTYLYIQTTSISENYLSNKVVISPNPFSISSMIEFVEPVLNFENVLFVLYDVLGNEVKRIELNAPKTKLDRSDIARGIYFYKIIDDTSSIANGKLIID